MAKAPAKSAEFIKAIHFDTIDIRILGTSPLIMHRFSRKAWQELLLPSGRKNEAERGRRGAPGKAASAGTVGRRSAWCAKVWQAGHVPALRATALRGLAGVAYQYRARH